MGDIKQMAERGESCILSDDMDGLRQCLQLIADYAEKAGRYKGATARARSAA